jgi:hypothetical protein
MALIDDCQAVLENNADAFALIKYNRPLTDLEKVLIVSMSRSPELNTPDLIAKAIQDKLPEGLCVAEVQQAMDTIRDRFLNKREPVDSQNERAVLKQLIALLKNALGATA